jgi:simple sugar transport system permease protein
MVSFAFGAAWTFRRTKLGLALRAAGEFPEAVAASGFSVLKLRFGAMLVGGALGGLAGAYLSLGISGSFAENMTAGRGFVAIAMVTFGRWKPIWVLAASMLVGYAVSLQFVFQSKGWNIPFQLLSAAPYVLALLVLVAAGRGSASPAALGKSFRSDR